MEILELEIRKEEETVMYDGPRPCHEYLGQDAYCKRCGVAWERH